MPKTNRGLIDRERHARRELADKWQPNGHEDSSRRHCFKVQDNFCGTQHAYDAGCGRDAPARHARARAGQPTRPDDAVERVAA